MRKVCVFVVITVLIAGMLCGCMPEEYPFKNSNETVASVELLFNPHAHEGYTGKSFELICELDKESAENFMREVVALKTSKCITPPASNYGFYVARVTYADGDIELFGTRHIEYVESGGVQSGVGAYSFDEDAFKSLFYRYCQTVEGVVIPPIPEQQEKQEDDSLGSLLLRHIAYDYSLIHAFAMLGLSFLVIKVYQKKKAKNQGDS